MEGIEHSSYPCANALVANDKPTIAWVELAELGRPNAHADEVMVTSENWHFSDMAGYADDVRSWGAKQTSRRKAATSAYDPDCVKTRC